jgi:hypothetical protein
MGGPMPGAGGMGPDDASARHVRIMRALLSLGQQFESLATDAPELQSSIAQVRQILRSAITTLTQSAPQQSGSADVLPMG